MPSRKRLLSEDSRDLTDDTDSCETEATRHLFRKRVAIHVDVDEYDIERRDPFNFDPEGDDRSNYVGTTDENSSEHGYADHISVGSESQQNDFDFGSTSTVEADESGADEDERYARLLQQQEIALARSYDQEGFLSHQWIVAMAESEESIDMSYESLLELQENLGEVKKRGLEGHSLNALPRVRYTDGLVEKEARNCVVCMTDFEIGDELVKLSCTHHFHRDCATNWLRNRATCPICREAIPEASVTIDL